MIPEDSLKMFISKEDWRKQWRRWQKTTSSSELGLHFGHNIAGCELDHISFFHALRSTLVVKRGVILEQWARGLSVMLEKMFGCALITKSRSILLMEVDFNSTKKIIYGQRMPQTARDYKLIPEEIYSERNCLSDNGTLAKVLFCDIVRQTRIPAGISAVDADNRIVHPIASMIFSSPWSTTGSMCLLFEHNPRHEVFLCTGFGNSKDYARSTGGIKTQEMC
jgi:hypothetical protein